jgi:Uri superfamily endonuclease
MSAPGSSLPGRAAITRHGDSAAAPDEAVPVNHLYIVATWVPRRSQLPIASLGAIVFERGWYAYVGSARRGRHARVARHFRREKPLRWHADHLFSAFPPRLAWLVDGAIGECELADSLAGLPGASRRPARFGSSDCGCDGHLVHSMRAPTPSLTAHFVRIRGRVDHVVRVGD